MTDSRDEDVLVSLYADLLADVTARLDVGAGLSDIEEPPRRHEALRQDIEFSVTLDAGLNAILPRGPESDERRRNSRTVKRPAKVRGSSAEEKTKAITHIDAVLSDLTDIHQWATGTQATTDLVEAWTLESARVYLRELRRGISEGSMSLGTALSRVREAARNVNDFMIEGIPLAVGAVVRQAMERLQQLEALLPTLFDSSGNAARTLR